MVYVIIHVLLQGGSSAAEMFMHQRETPKIGFNHRTEVGYQIANADPKGSPTTSTYVKKKKVKERNKELKNTLVRSKK